MRRRDFLRTTPAVGLTATALAADGPPGQPATPDSRVPAPGAIVVPPRPRLIADYGAADHRDRLRAIAFGTATIHDCLRRHLVTNYLPAQCCYNLGEYPATRPWDPGEEDEAELDRLAALGVEVLQVFDDWNDSLRLFGGDKYSPVNREGYVRFLAMARRRGFKVLTYVSPCFIQRTDPDFDPAWSRPGDFLVVEDAHGRQPAPRPDRAADRFAVHAPSVMPRPCGRAGDRRRRSPASSTTGEPTASTPTAATS